jgi:hypothetical protein
MTRELININRCLPATSLSGRWKPSHASASWLQGAARIFIEHVVEDVLFRQSLSPLVSSTRPRSRHAFCDVPCSHAGQHLSADLLTAVAARRSWSVILATE